MTLIFILTTLFFLLGGLFFIKVIHFSTQNDQWLDMLFGWQNMINKFGNKTGGFNRLMFKMLGGCEFCFSYWMSFIVFGFYAAIMVLCLKIWPHFDSYLAQGLFSFCWYLVYVSTSTVLSTLVITRL